MDWPELQRRAAGYGVFGDLRRYDVRLELVRAWQADLQESAVPLMDRMEAFRALGGERVEFSEALELGSGYALVTCGADSGGFYVTFRIVDGTVPPPLPRETLAAQLDSTERLDGAFDTIERMRDWVAALNAGDIEL